MFRSPRGNRGEIIYSWYRRASVHLFIDRASSYWYRSFHSIKCQVVSANQAMPTMRLAALLAAVLPPIL